MVYGFFDVGEGGDVILRNIKEVIDLFMQKKTYQAQSIIQRSMFSLNI